MPQSSDSYREWIVVASGLLVTSVIATWPMAARIGSALPGDLGDPVLNAWILAWDADRVAHGFRGLWDAPIFFPSTGTLMWSEHLLGIAIPLAPLQWISHNPILVYNVAFIGSYVLAGVGGYVLGRELALGRPASVVAACACAFAPYRADQITHLQVLMIGWASLALAALHRWLNSGSLRAALAFGAAFGLLALSNTYYLFYFAPAVAVVVASSIIGRRVRVRSLVKGAVPAAALLAAMLGPVLLEYWRTRQSTGLARGWDEIAHFSARGADYLAVAVSARLWRDTLHVAPAEHALFPGVTIVALSMVALVHAVSRRDFPARYAVWVYLSIAILAAWGTLGPGGGLYAFALSVVPGLDALRVVTRLFSVASLALAVLAACGTEALVARRSRAARVLFASVLALLIFAEGLSAPLGAVPFDPRLPAEKRPMYGWLAQQPPGAVLELPIAGPALGEHTLLYQFATLVHGHPIVNGYSGTGSALQDFLASRHSPIYEPGRLQPLLQALRGLGVRYIVMHQNWIASQTRAQWLRQAMDGCGDQIEAVFHGGDAIAWTLKAAPASAAPRHQDTVETQLQPRSYTLTASAEGVQRLNDGDVSTRWSTGAQTGREWLRASFGHVADISRVTLDLAWRRAAEYPRNLVIESVGSDGSGRVLFAGSTLPLLLPALIRHGPAIQLTISLPRNSSSALIIRQTDIAPAPWSAEELRLWVEQR